MAPRKPEPNSYPKYFRWIYESLRDNFYDPRLNGVEIEKVGAGYAEQVATVRDDADFVLLQCLRALRVDSPGPGQRRPDRGPNTR